MAGGVIASLADFLTTISTEVATSKEFKEDVGMRGVSIDLTTQYFRAIELPNEVIVQSVLRKLGKKLVFLDCDFECKHTGKSLAKVTHVKYLL